MRIQVLPKPNSWLALAAMAFSFPLAGQPVITTFAGNGVAGYNGDSIAATAAQLSLPMGVAADSLGNIYIADTANHRVRKVSSGGIITTFAGTGVAGYSGDTGQAASAQLNQPSSVAVDSNGNVYIADRANHRIRKVTPGGVISTVVGTGTAGFSGDNGAATSAQLNFPRTVIVDSQANLYITDTDNHRVRKVTAAGTISTFAGNGQNSSLGDSGAATSAAVGSPWGLALDASGNLYISQYLLNVVRKVSAGVITTYAGTGIGGYNGDGAAANTRALQLPAGLAVDPLGNLFIADQANHRVRKVTSGGIISTVAGTGNAGFSGDGSSPTAAELNSPISVGLDSSGSLYIGELSNFRVRKATLLGVAVPHVNDTNPLFSAGLNQTLVLKFTDPAGVNQLGVVNALINSALDGNAACYIAYSRPFGVLFLVNDGGPASGLSAPLVLGGSGSVTNGQCTIFASGSSAVASGNILTLTLNVTFKSPFLGNKILYMAARDVNEVNSGWVLKGVVQIPGAPVSFPQAVASTPGSGTGSSQVFSFTYQDAANANNLQTTWALINADLDGRQACYTAYYAPANLLLLVPDNGDGSQATFITLSGANTIENSQCRISASGSSVVASGNQLTVTLNITFKSPFAGPKGIWAATQTLGGAQTSPWKIVGAWQVQPPVL